MSDFLTDLDRLPNGLQTEIGERGTTLSGGQQQRLSIARALYTDPELLILDDPLAAVDAVVCQRIFQRAILGRVARVRETFPSMFLCIATHPTHTLGEGGPHR
jgi:ABC-type multidrug transport system fused ATPase/permease subunit